MKFKLRQLVAEALIASLQGIASAHGVSPYLPLHLEPHIERQIERVLILADRPVISRPIPAATVFDALPRACQVDTALCEEVRAYLLGYMHTFGVSRLSVQAGTSDDVGHVIPNEHGLTTASSWQASANAIWQPNDYVLFNLGGVAYQGDTMPTGSVVSLGFDRAQLDIGFREHWLSPFTDNSLLMSTEAPSIPSVTLSNYTPLTRMNFQYEFFLARLSESSSILLGTDPTTGKSKFTTGHPKLAGLHLSMEPASGWSLAVNRLMQFDGGARGPNSLRGLVKAFFNPAQYDNGGGQSEAGNQVGSITSRFIFPAAKPFSVYFEYGGEDTSRGRSWLLGNSALSMGIDIPRLWRSLDFTYEVSEWQNGWYVNHIYGDGLTNDGHVLGNWAADQRQFGDGVGGLSQSVQLGWEPRFGGALTLNYRTVKNESYSPVDYEHAYDVTLRYAYPLKQFTVGAEALAGHDVFGEDFSHIAAFVSYSPNGEQLAASDYIANTRLEGAELFVDAGASASELKSDESRDLPQTKTGFETTAHLALGARRAVTDNDDLGVRIEFDDVNNRSFIGVRAIDYRYRFANPLALGFFIGAARYDLATPAYGIYLGGGAQWRNVLPGWDLGFDFRYASNLARDHLVPSDPPVCDGCRPDSFHFIRSGVLYLTRRF